MDLPKIVQEDDLSYRLLNLSEKLHPKKIPQSRSDDSTIGLLKSVSALLNHERENLRKYSKALDTLIQTILRFFSAHRPAVL